MSSLRRVVLDVLKPHDPPLVEFTDRLADLESVDGAAATLIELDTDVQNVALTVEGPDVDYERLEAEIETLGASVHSVDRVVCGDVTGGENPLDDGA